MKRSLGIFVPAEASYFSRLTLKFVEIVAAGVATAVSGYLVAHLSGYLSSPTPVAAVQTAPRAGAYGSLRAPPAPAVSADAQGPAPQQNTNPPPTVTPAAAAANTAHMAPARKPVKTEARTTESKPRDAAETKPHDAAETKPHDMKSIEAEVRAALADANANHAAPSHHTDGVPGPPAVGAQPRPVDDAALGGVAAMPHAADVAPQPAQQAPVALAPPAPVDIKSLPVAGVDPSQPQQPAAPAQEASQGENKAAANGLFSVFANLPNLLRSDTPRPDSEAPRPPMPIGQ